MCVCVCVCVYVCILTLTSNFCRYHRHFVLVASLRCVPLSFRTFKDILYGRFSYLLVPLLIKALCGSDLQYANYSILDFFWGGVMIAYIVTKCYQSFGPKDGSNMFF